MTPPPDFDPYALLGVDGSADAATIDRAYKSRIRYVHPDIAGAAGLDETKRLNIAREWLLDPELREQLPKPTATARRRAAPPRPPTPPPQPRRPPAAGQTWEKRPRQRQSRDYDPFEDDPFTYDYGAHSDDLGAFFEVIRSLTADERARVTYSLGDEPPFLFDQFKDVLGDRTWAQSRALEDAIERVWGERQGEDTPLLFPRGRVFGNGAVVANAYAQWSLLSETMRRHIRSTDVLAALATRSREPWEASVGHVRYGTYQREVLAFLADAKELSRNAAVRLSRSWDRHMGTYVYGRPGEDWFPGTGGYAPSLVVSARLAAVDASRIEPPVGIDFELHNGFRYGLRLTAYVLALGGIDQPGRDYMRPWQDALNENPSFSDRARWGMPLG